jgi:Recombination endonuclease VII
MDGRALCVDHDHSTGQVRGLLCKRCNYALGLLEDTKSLVRAVEYLHRALDAQLERELRKG